MKVPMKKAQVLMAWLGQKVVLTEPIDDGVLLYPVGAVGTFDAIRAGSDGEEPFAEVVFDNDPRQDLVQVPLDSLVPMEFAAGELPDLPIAPTAAFRLEKLRKSMVKTVPSNE